MQENFHIGTNMGIKTLYHNLTNFRNDFGSQENARETNTT